MSTVHIKREEILRLFDTRSEVGTGFATAFSALAGEEMGIALLEHCLDRQGKTVKRLEDYPRTGRKSGPRLDGWLDINGELAQVEVKNWGANAFGGLEHSGSPMLGWQQFMEWFAKKDKKDEQKINVLQKVLYSMQPPQPYKNVDLAIACMWPVMHAQGGTESYFPCSIEPTLRPLLNFETKFKQLHIFSMSAYLRELKDEFIELDMPKTYARLQKFENILGIRGAAGFPLQNEQK